MYTSTIIINFGDPYIMSKGAFIIYGWRGGGGGGEKISRPIVGVGGGGRWVTFFLKQTFLEGQFFFNA